MTKRLMIMTVMLLSMVPTFAGNKVSKYAGLYKYDADERYGEARVACDANGNVYFEGNVVCEGDLGVFKPENFGVAKLQGNKAVFTKDCDGTIYTATLTFEGNTLTITEENAFSNIDFGRKAYLEGTYTKDEAYVGDDKFILYSYINEGHELGVVKGGRYTGNLMVPASVNVNGKEIPVTTVRKNAFQHDFDTPEAHMLKSVSLPAVTLVGVNAFDGNRELATIKYGKPQTVCVEAGAYFNCPKLNVGPEKFLYAFNDCGDQERATFLVACAKPMEDASDYRWACFKHWHNRMKTIGFNDPKGENTGDYYHSCWEYAKGQKFELLNKSAAANMFWGYQGPMDVVLATNGYVGKHTFPMYSRWVYGEEKINMPAQFQADIAKRYGRKVKYSYEAAKLKDGFAQLAITEFEIKDKEAMVVYSWVRFGDVMAEHVETTKVEDDYDGYSLWNVDDEGEYGIPEILCIAYDDKENVEIFINKPAPESTNYMRMVQKGKKLEIAEEDETQLYNYYN